MIVLDPSERYWHTPLTGGIWQLRGHQARVVLFTA